MRIRILLFSSLTSRRQQKTNLKKRFSAYYFFKVLLHHFSKVKSKKKVTKQQKSRFFFYFCFMIKRSGYATLPVTITCVKICIYLPVMIIVREIEPMQQVTQGLPPAYYQQPADIIIILQIQTFLFLVFV
jgi:hypothetical protein